MGRRFARLPDRRSNQRRSHRAFAAATLWPRPKRRDLGLISLYLIVLASITFVATMAAPEMAGKSLK